MPRIGDKTIAIKPGGGIMNRTIILCAIGLTLAGSAAVLAAQAPQQPMSFFVTSTVPGTGNLGGLAGADQNCQNLAAAAGAGQHARRERAWPHRSGTLVQRQGSTHRQQRRRSAWRCSARPQLYPQGL